VPTNDDGQELIVFAELVVADEDDDDEDSLPPLSARKREREENPCSFPLPKPQPTHQPSTPLIPLSDSCTPEYPSSPFSVELGSLWELLVEEEEYRRGRRG